MLTPNSRPISKPTTPWGVDGDGLPVYRIVPPRADWLALVREDALEPTLPIIDPHHHLWELNGSYLLDELLADLDSGHRIAGTVYSQCGYAYNLAAPLALRPVGETAFVVRVAREARQRNIATAVCAGIVAYADMTLGDDVRPVLEAHALAGDGRLRGIRHITALHAGFNASLLGRPPANLMAEPSFRRGLAQLQSMNLAFDAWLYHTQIGELVDLARAMPELPIVLNHLGGPIGIGPYTGRRDESRREWLKALGALAQFPNVHLKLGGLSMTLIGFDFHQQPRPPTSTQLAEAWRPYIEPAIELFGARRCMFESNFPVDSAMCSYGVLWNAFKRITAKASADDKTWLYAGTADRFYRLNLLPR